MSDDGDDGDDDEELLGTAAKRLKPVEPKSDINPLRSEVETAREGSCGLEEIELLVNPLPRLHFNISRIWQIRFYYSLEHFRRSKSYIMTTLIDF